MISKRKTRLLKSIIKDYTKTAQPVGSTQLLEKHNLPVSSATIRNEMLELDRLGFLEQPHTSAGRIPTEKAYKLIEKSIKPKKLSARQQQVINDAVKMSAEKREQIKHLAKAIAQESKEFIITAFSDNDFYYTGLTNLFSKPEFSQQNIICNISQVIDHLDSRLSSLYKSAKLNPTIYIGKENPIDECLSLVVTKVEESGVLMGILGPMRMKYSTNLGLLEYVIKLISK